MNFQLAPEAEEKKVFLADFSELSDRFDPEMVLFRRKSHNFRFPTRKLQEFFRLPPQYGANERGIERTTNTGPRYVRITDINEFGYLSDELGATAEVIEPQYLLNENDLLFARSGNTVGKCYIHKQEHAAYDCFFAGYLIRLCFEDEEILPDYIFALTQLPYYKSWVKAIQRTSGQPNINAQEYANLEVCAAPRPIQEKVVERLEAAYAQKREVEAQAKAQLARIDEILLAELGITPPVPTPDAVENRCFFRQFSEVTGERIDPIANQPKRLGIENAVARGKYPTRLLHELVWMPKIITTEIDSASVYIGLENIDGATGEYVKTGEKESIGTALCFLQGEILFPKLRPYLNKTHLAQFNGICSTEMHVFQAHGIEPRFLTEFLRFSLTVELTTLLMTGSTLPRLQMQDIERLAIPLPPRDVQDTIVAKIEELRQSARALFAQAQAELDAAKVAIEGMILGEDSP